MRLPRTLALLLIVAFVCAPLGVSQALAMPGQVLDRNNPEAACDLPKDVRKWFYNFTRPGSCVQCSNGISGTFQNEIRFTTLLWPTHYGPAEHHGSGPSRVAGYARSRGVPIYNVTGAQVYDWEAWAIRNGRYVAIGFFSSHFQSLVNHDPATDTWFVVNNNSPTRVDVYSRAQYERYHKQSGHWCVIINGHAAARPPYYERPRS